MCPKMFFRLCKKFGCTFMSILGVLMLLFWTSGMVDLLVSFKFTTNATPDLLVTRNASGVFSTDRDNSFHF